MVDIVDVVNQIAAAQSSDAKDSLHNILSQKAFGALETKKQDIAKNLFASGEEHPENSEEDLDVEVQDPAETPVEDSENEGEDLDTDYEV